MTRERLTEIIREVLAEEIRKINGKYVVYPKGGGKRLGTHGTRAEAEKQLTAIHLNKEVMEPADPSKVDAKELKIGVKVEMEHTDDPKEAEKIALQHLAEDPKYYTKLTAAGLEEGPHDAMNPGILSKDSSLKGKDGKIKISKVRQKLSSMKDKGSTKAKALRRFINYHD
jgi:hypothetical protein